MMRCPEPRILVSRRTTPERLDELIAGLPLFRIIGKSPRVRRHVERIEREHPDWHVIRVAPFGPMDKYRRPLLPARDRYDYEAIVETSPAPTVTVRFD